jgi:protein-S-isoprenylcysteine O-methyltransferase Ste14
MSPAVRTTLYVIVFLAIVLGYLPWQVLRLDAVLGDYVGTLLQSGAVLLFLTGVLVLFSGAYYLVVRGEGTPLPFDPPKRMVVAGPYAYIQHPMALGLLLIAFAEALWLASPSLVIYALLLTVLLNVYILYIEEPGLARRFGEDYRTYQAVTPRWIPFSRPKA